MNVGQAAAGHDGLATPRELLPREQAETRLMSAEGHTRSSNDVRCRPASTLLSGHSPITS